MHVRMQKGVHVYYAEVRQLHGLVSQGLARSD
jgi:hypothetical protein